MKEIKKVFIVGSGTMGNGIAQVVADSGYEVRIHDKSQELIEKALITINHSLARFVNKGKKTEEEKSAILDRISSSMNLTDGFEADIVIEAVFENLEVKMGIFRTLDSICKENCIFASNTSSLPISAIATATGRRDKVIGTHFMNPVPLMRGVEIIPGVETSDNTLNITKDFIKSLGKEPVVAHDYAGFVASRVLDVMLNEAVKCVMDGNDPEEIDKAMKLCCNFPMGPLELIDLAGADILLHVMDTMENEYGDRYHAAPLLRQMVRAGHLGRKTGKGFYDYTKK